MDSRHRRRSRRLYVVAAAQNEGFPVLFEVASGEIRRSERLERQRAEPDDDVQDIPID